MVMRMMTILLQLVLVMIAAASPSPSPSSGDTVMCRPDERDALLSFKSAFSIDNSSYSVCDAESRAKTKSWEKDGNCCKWDGVTCDPQTSHVVELDLSCSHLSGSIPSNTTLFRLPNLQILNLAFNFLSGQVPQEIGWLSHLTSLDLSYNYQLSMPNFQTIISNLTDLIELDLSFVNIATHLPPIIYNLSNLASLDLFWCNLISDFPSENVGTSMLAGVTYIDLSYSMLTGVIPGWLFTLPSLSSLHLPGNLFTRISKFEIGNASSLTLFVAYSNHLQGNILDSIFELHSLTILNLQQNNLTGTIPLSRFRKLQNLIALYLSDNSLTIIDDIDISKPSWPDLNYLSLSSCNLGHFPDFIRQYRNLYTLELSNNGIPGLVPNWLSELGTLRFLNLSNNSLQGGLENLPWQGMFELDIQYNMFHGIVPIPPPTTKSFWASNNQFTGEVPSSLCNVSGLELLDLAHNNLTGSIPECIASLIKSGLYVLDLRKNQLHGAIPSSLFEECPNLEFLSLSDNKLECQIPKSLINCWQLELLDLSRNNFNDKFPYWLGFFPFLQVLILASNKLHGSIMESNTTSSFRMLQILDISDNAFTSTLPVELLMSMEAMATVDNDPSLPYLSSFGGYDTYQDSVVMWIKGITRRLDAIYDKLVLIDMSRNRLEGLIPDAIGDLVSLRGLNLAHNNFTGHIPPSLGNLSLLESLDLSFNRLEGSIPIELVNLNSLAFFNVSENNLVGPVPTTKQFGTFSEPSYLGNPGLCGPWLTNECGKPRDAPQNSSASEGIDEESSSLQVWEIGMIGCECGLLGGLAWGYVIFWANSPYWVQRLIFQIETIVIGYQWRKRKNITRRIKKLDTQGRRI